MQKRETLPSSPLSLQRKYQKLTSPLINLQQLQLKEQQRAQLSKNINMRYELMKVSKNGKGLNGGINLSVAELKASCFVYRVPEFSTPEINYQVADLIKKKVQQMNNQIISYLPQISRSSNYAPNKLEHQINHRAVVRQLEDWLKVKLKNPPCNYQQSIQYKNMIMGVGMKELIRIISKRCLEEGKMTEEIWELTWAICREIIVYLAKRANKCQAVLEEELMFLKQCYQAEFDRFRQLNLAFSQKINYLQQQNKQYLNQILKLRKRQQYLQSQNKNMQFTNSHHKQQYKNVLQQNLALYLQMGDKNKRGWIKMMYKKINQVKTQSYDQSGQIRKQFQGLLKQQVKYTIDERVKLQNVTGDNDVIRPAQKIDTIIVGVGEGSKQQQSQEQVRQYTTEAQLFELDYQQDLHQQQEDFVNKLRQQFKPIDTGTQTEVNVTINTLMETVVIEMCQTQTQIQTIMLNLYFQMGINTEEHLKQDSKIKKKLVNRRDSTKQNKQEGKSKEKQKNMTNRDNIKIKNSIVKNEKDTKNNLQTVQQEIQIQKEKEQNYEQPMPQVKLVHRFSQNIIIPLQYKIDDKPHLQNKNKSVIIETNTLNFELFSDKINTAFITETQNKQKYDSIQMDVKVGSNAARQQSTHIKTIQQCNIYICADCNKIITANDQKYKPKNMDNLAKYNHPQFQDYANKKATKRNLSRHNSYDKLQTYHKQHMTVEKLMEVSQEQYEKREAKQQRQITRKKQNRRNSGYMHDIGFAKSIEEHPFKSTFYKQQKGRQEDLQQPQQLCTILSKTSAFHYLYTQINISNVSLIANIQPMQQQTSQNLQHYFQMVKQINNLPQGRLNMSQKSVCSTIEKNIFQLMIQLMGFVKKACKKNKISQTMKTFMSLPNIVYNRMSRKYGMKILAIKNMKILLMALKAAQKITQKYMMIQLMMFTDCKAPYSQDLFVYLLVMGQLDPTFSSSKLVSYQQAHAIKKLCWQYLSKHKQVYAQFQKLTREDGEQQRMQSNNAGLSLLQLIKSIITSYRLLKIAKSEELGFIFLMLQKDHFMDYQVFLYFLSTFAIEHSRKVAIAKKLMAFCDGKNRDKQVSISQNMFSKFLMNCQELTLELLSNAINAQKRVIQNKDISMVNIIQQKICRMKSDIKTVSNVKQVAQNEDRISNELATEQPKRQSISSEQQSDTTEVVLQQVKSYSFFTYRISNYLQNSEDNKYLTNIQRTFIKDYLIMHILECETDQVMGIVDYFSNGMLELICMPHQEFIIKDGNNEHIIKE